MTRLSREQRILSLLENEKVFLLLNSDNKEHWYCIGEKGLYDITYFKDKDSYTCSCKNVRLVKCYHIEACERMRNAHNT